MSKILDDLCHPPHSGVGLRLTESVELSLGYRF